jgi:hypothetical protein
VRSGKIHLMGILKTRRTKSEFNENPFILNELKEFLTFSMSKT